MVVSLLWCTDPQLQGTNFAFQFQSYMRQIANMRQAVTGYQNEFFSAQCNVSHKPKCKPIRTRGTTQYLFPLSDVSSKARPSNWTTPLMMRNLQLIRDRRGIAVDTSSNTIAFRVTNGGRTVAKSSRLQYINVICATSYRTPRRRCL